MSCRETKPTNAAIDSGNHAAARKDDCNRVLCHFANLWGYGVRLNEVETDGDVIERYEVVAMRNRFP